MGDICPILHASNAIGLPSECIEEKCKYWIDKEPEPDCVIIKIYEATERAADRPVVY